MIKDFTGTGQKWRCEVFTYTILIFPSIEIDALMKTFVIDRSKENITKTHRLRSELNISKWQNYVVLL